jgi:CheY-like chemotaxis protein
MHTERLKCHYTETKNESVHGRERSLMTVGDPGKSTDIDGRRFEELQSRIALLEGELAVRDGLEVLAGGIAHDFNNLLTVILNNISLMKLETDPVSPAMVSLEEMEKATLKARDLAWKLLNIAGNGSAPRPRENSHPEGGSGLDELAGTGRVLLVDDEEEVRKSTGAALGRLGYTVVLAENGSEAIEIFCQAADEGRPFDLVILDLTVHGGTGGKETLSRLKRIDPAVKAVVSSGYANDAVMSDFADFGFCDRLAKPYTMEDLGRVVRSALDASDR